MLLLCSPEGKTDCEERNAAGGRWNWMRMRGREKKREGKNGEKSDENKLVEKYTGSRFNLVSTPSALLLTSLPSTLVGVGLGCSSCYECVLGVSDRPGATQRVGLQEETSNSVRTFL